MQKRRSGIAQIFLALIGGGAVIYAAVVITSPWALRIGGRWTPLLFWQGSGKLMTRDGFEYPLYIYLYPSSHFSRLRMDGLRPTGGLQGRGWLCTSRGTMQQLKLSGTIYGGWRSTADSVMAFRLLEPKIIDVGQRQGYFDLTGRWRGQELVMDDRSGMEAIFRSGLKIRPSSVSFNWSDYSDFKTACASMETSAPPK